jgi:ABC-type nitrate/sulfonate/bicarbonate transport system permease component
MTASAVATTRRRARGLPKVNGPGLLLGALLVLAWEGAVRAGLLSAEIVPAPSAVWSAAVRLTESGALPDNVAHTLTATLIGWVIAATVGIVLGLAMGLLDPLRNYTAATVEVLRAVPAISFVPLAVLLLGFSVEMEVAIIVYVSQWPVLINTIAGVRSVTPVHREVARTMQLGHWDRIRKVTLPSAVPNVLIGLRLALALSLALAVVAEMVGNPKGIGYALILHQQALQPAELFAYLVLTGVLGLLLNSLFVGGARLLSPGTAAALRETA